MAKKNSKKKRFLAESEISKWIVSLIENQILRETISGKDKIRKIKAASSQHGVIPSLSIDYVSRLACINAADYVLNSLHSLEVVAIDKSISIEKGKVLRTDIIAFNQETNTLIVFELKRDSATERQAVTELMGYEQELKNIFPFLGNFDVCFVIIAKDWSTLLDHATGSMNAWSGKQCLALKISQEGNQNLLECHLPEAWYLRGSFGIPEDAIQTLDIVLYCEDSNENEERLLSTALDIVARDGDRSNSHGFVLLSKILKPFSNTKWILTICSIDPLAMFHWCIRNGLTIRDSATINYFKKQSNNYLGQPSPSTRVVYEEALRFLSEYYSPQFENYMSLNEKLIMLQRQASPIQFDFWGKLGEYSRSFICNSVVRSNLMPYVGKSALDWKYPEVAFPLLGYLTNHAPFPDGRVNCESVFQLGVAIGTLLSQIAAYEMFEINNGTNETQFLMWCDLEVLKFALEVNQIYRSTSDIQEPPPVLSRSDTESRKTSLSCFCEWVVAHLIGKENIVHLHCFELGIQGGPFFAKQFRDERHGCKGTPMQLQLQQVGQNLVKVIILKYFSDEDEKPTHELNVLHDFLFPSLVNHTSKNETYKTLLNELSYNYFIDHFEYSVLPLLDVAISVVPHLSPAPIKMAIDWDWLKDGIDKLYAEGCSHPVVIFSANGNVGTGKGSGDVLYLRAIPDRNDEVYVLDERAGYSFGIIKKWNELESYYV